MSAFWENMTAANDSARETLGESVLLDNVEWMGIVDSASYEEAAVAGGRKVIVNCRVLVGAEVVPYDGMLTTVRGADGKVGSWEMLTPDGTRWLNIGSRNRWSGDVPGV